MPLSQNPILRAAHFKALPRIMTFRRVARIGLKPSSLNDIEKEKAKNCIEYYFYLQTHLEDTELFREVFKAFYLRNTRRGTWTENDYNLYFNKLFSFETTGDCVRDVDSAVTFLQENLSKHRFELSFSSKLVHTRNTDCPIFDSGVVKYLKEFENVYFPVSKETNFSILNTWYNNFINTDQRYHSWLEWFDETFPEYVTISNIKKIDFILFFGK